MSAQLLAVSIGSAVGTLLGFERDAWAVVK